MSYQYLVGATVDYLEDLQGSRFIIHNPNALLLKLSRREEQTRNANSIAYSSVL
jgi:hypothetical protein